MFGLNPPDGTDPSHAPAFDEIDPDWKEVVHEAFERIARREPPWLVANYLAQEGLLKTANSKLSNWTGDNVKAMIRSPIYRGIDVYRETTSDRKRRTGKRRAKKNDPAQVLTREMPHLRLVEDELALAATAAIDGRNHNPNQKSGRDHPLYGIPRDSRGPLSTIFTCGICNGAMHVNGRQEGGYRCGNAKRHDVQECWNRATTLREVCHREIGKAIVDALLDAKGRLPEVVRRVEEVLDDGGRFVERSKVLHARKQTLEKKLDSLGRLCERANERLLDSLDRLLDRYDKRSHQLDRIDAMLERLERRKQQTTLPSAEKLRASIDEAIERLNEMKSDVRGDLERFGVKIHAVPFRQFGSDKVVLRAQFSLDILGLLPYPTFSCLQAVYGDSLYERFPRSPILVDLFEPSTGPKYGRVALSLYEQGMGLTAIGRKLEITKRQANIAVQYGRKLREAGLDDPFIELTEPPENASRWRLPAHRQQSGSLEASGPEKDAA